MSRASASAESIPAVALVRSPSSQRGMAPTSSDHATTSASFVSAAMRRLSVLSSAQASWSFWLSAMIAVTQSSRARGTEFSGAVSASDVSIRRTSPNGPRQAQKAIMCCASSAPAAASPGWQRQKSSAAHRLSRSSAMRRNISACLLSQAPADRASAQIQSKCRFCAASCSPSSRSRCRPYWRSVSSSQYRGGLSPRSRRFRMDFSTSSPSRPAIRSSGSRRSEQTWAAASSSNPPANTHSRAHSSRSCSPSSP
jgi:hypothetical protein